MISDLAEVASGMIFEQDAPLLQDFDFGSDLKETLYEEFIFLEYLFQEENLPFVYEYIHRNPHSKLEKYSETIPTAFAYNVGPSELIDMVSKAENLSKTRKAPDSWPRNMRNHIPDSINHDYFEDTLDTPENRLLKYYLESVDKLIFDLVNKAEEGQVLDKLIKYQEIIQNYLSDRWLRDVGNLEYIPMNSQVMQKKEGYREIFKYYLYFEFAFRLKWVDIEDKLQGYERKLSELYEYWCYIELLKVLSELSGQTLNFDNVYKVDPQEWSISLKKGRINAQKFKWIHDGHPLTVKVIYGAKFSRESYSLPLNPDYTLMINYQGKEHLLHFDAKYKLKKKFLDYLTWDNLDLENKEYKPEDIYKMHTYKDAIKNSLGAYVLYPGDISRTFEENKGDCVPSVGAFHLTPGGNTASEENKLENFIENVLKVKN